MIGNDINRHDFHEYEYKEVQNFRAFFERLSDFVLSVTKENRIIHGVLKKLFTAQILVVFFQKKISIVKNFNLKI